MVRSVKNWLTLLLLALVLVDIALVYLYVVPPLADRLAQDKLDSLVKSSDLIKQTFSNEVNSNPVALNIRNIFNQASFFDSTLNARVVVYDVNSTPLSQLVDSRRGQALTPSDYPVIADAAQTGDTQVEEVTIDGSRYAAAAIPIHDINYPTVAYVVLISAPLSDVNAAVSAVQRQILLAGAIALVFSLVTGYTASYLIARRLKRIERGAVSIAQGDLSTVIQTGWRDEIGQLAAAFNTMGQRLRDAFALIAREKENADVLLTDLSEGVIGVSVDGVVAIANPAATRLLGVRMARGVHLAGALPDELATALAEVQADGEDRTTVLRHGDLTLEGSVYRTGRETEVRHFVVLRDITEQARLDRARRDFIATASHELKTPLFSLSGFMELIDEGDLDSEQQREFLAIMRQQVDRLTDLSLSLLDLSQVDAGTVGLELGDTDVTAVARAVAIEFQPVAATREVVLTVDGQSGESAFCDERRLGQVLRALLDNAVKFSPPQGTVEIAVKSGRKMVSVTIADQGPGIPAKELGRIFERFYRGAADGAAKQGTGLGLSIARDMAELMGGNLTARSTSGSGALFTLQLPRSK
jgi:two-component system, OmpR family, sensor histidine kinase VicK